MRFVIAGASGFLGTALRERLARDGHEVARLVRGEAVSQSESSWDPYAGRIDQALVDRADVVVNLAGAPIAHWPWTPAYQRKIRESRLATTETLARAVAASPARPALLAQSGIAGYGDRAGEVLTEDSSTPAETMLGRLTRDWEAATLPAAEAGSRVCMMRTAVVLHRSGGMMKLLLPLYRLGLGGSLGNGRQYFPTISLHDWVHAVRFIAGETSSAGVYNLTGPQPTTNAEFTKELGRMLNRPTVLSVPAWPIRTFLGELSGELLGSIRLEPGRLRQAGFTFAHPTLNSRLAAALSG
jgi:uncharacterized protein (TIGR01777 family)